LTTPSHNVASRNDVALPITLLYSELHDLSAADEHRERMEGSFSVKRINDRRYWYHQFWVGHKRVQKAIGLESPEVLDHINAWKTQAKAWRADNRRRAQIVRSLKAALGMTTDLITGRVIARLSELGVFKVGAVLIGTHAYITYGPMLGVRLAQSNLRTGDIDFGAVDVAATDVQVSFSDAVQSADNAFFVVPARPGSRISTALKYQGGEARVELLTPLRKGRAWTPEVISSLKFGAQRAPYLDYLIEDTVDATYLIGEGVRVRVPHPARFAWHKLIVASNREVASHSKALKDLAQSSELFRVLLDARPKEVRQAAHRLLRYGGAYVKRARQSAAKLDPALKKEILGHLK
jgi:hypothetical protein